MMSRNKMQMKAAIVTVIGSAALLLSCATGGKTPGSSASESVVDGKTGFRLPPYEEKTLANGLRVLFVPNQQLPSISLSLLVRGGSAQDTEGHAGLATLVAELLDKGTAKRSAPQIAQDLGQLGADFDASASMDYSVVSASALSTQADALLDNMVEIVMEPAFTDVEIERARKQLLAQIERQEDNPDAFADRAWQDFIYQSHPYAQPTLGNLQGVKAAKKKNIIQYYLRYYRPNNAILAVIGKYTPELVAKIEKSFGSWERREVPAVQYPVVPAIEGVQIRLVDKPGLVQSQIRIGHLGIKRQNDDFVALRVANTILGGAFASRLNDRIRKELGLTYSISSYFDARMDRGPFEISTFTKNTSTGQVVGEALKVLNDFKEQGVTSEEVNRAKGYLKGVFPTAIETPEKLALNLMLLRFYGIPDTYLTTYLSQVDRLSASAINSVIKKYVDNKNLKVVVYSASSEVLPQLEPLGKVEIKKAADLQ